MQKLLPEEIVFGGITLNVAVDGIPSNRTFKNKKELFEVAFDENPAFAYAVCPAEEGYNWFATTYVVFKNCVVQVFADNLNDCHGVISTLYQDIADELLTGEGAQGEAGVGVTKDARQGLGVHAAGQGMGSERMAEIAVLRTQIVNYVKTRDTYIAYRKAGYSKKFRAEHEADILLHQAAKRHFDTLGVTKLPTVKALNAEYAKLLADKKEAYGDYRQAREEWKEMLMAKANIDRILGMDAPDMHHPKGTSFGAAVSCPKR